jgi:YVTN family beta-propeller protein
VLIPAQFVEPCAAAEALRAIREPYRDSDQSWNIAIVRRGDLIGVLTGYFVDYRDDMFDEWFCVPAGRYDAQMTQYGRRSARRAKYNPSATTPTCAATIGIGETPSAVAITPDSQFAYITRGSSNTVAVVDICKEAIVSSIPVDLEPNRVAITPDGAHAYVTNSGWNNVSAIDTRTNSVAETIPVGAHPIGVAITPDGAHAYVANQASNSLSVIDTGAHAVVATLAVKSRPAKLAFTPDGRRAFVVHLSGRAYYSSGGRRYDTPERGMVTVIDVPRNTVTTTIPVGASSNGVAITPDGRHAYVTDSRSGTLTAIDTRANAVTATIPVGRHPGAVAITPDGQQAYVTLESGVAVIDLHRHRVETTVRVGTFPGDVVITPDGRHAYVNNCGSWSLSIIDMAGSGHKD